MKLTYSFIATFSVFFTFAQQSFAIPPNMGNHNDSSSCFLNATVQALFHLQPFRYFLKYAQEKNLYPPDTTSTDLINHINTMAENTQRIHVNRETDDEDQFNDFRKLVTNRDHEIAEMAIGQHDAHELLLHLLKKLSEESSDPQIAKTFLALLFSIGKKEELSYQNKIIRIKEDSNTNQVTPSLTNEDTQDYTSLNQFIEHEQEPANIMDYKLDKEQAILIGNPDLTGTHATVQKQTKITKLPWIITIQLNLADPANAYEEDDYELVIPKIKKLITIPEKIFNNYTLNSIAIHSGDSFDDGHYWTYARWVNDKWYHYDDISNPSSELNPDTLEQTIKPSAGAESQETPYLLFYVRDDFTPDALMLEVKLTLLKNRLVALKAKLLKLKESLEQLKKSLIA